VHSDSDRKFRKTDCSTEFIAKAATQLFEEPSIAESSLVKEDVFQFAYYVESFHDKQIIAFFHNKEVFQYS
jgi:hypothetical protein